MGLSFRKSIKAGPIKMNISRSGIGLSTGTKGAHVGISSRGGAYVSGGANGVYFRKKLGGKENTNATSGNEINEESVPLTEKQTAAGNIVATLFFAGITSILGFYYKPLFIIPLLIIAYSIIFALRRRRGK